MSGHVRTDMGQMPGPETRVAVVHDWLVNYAGSERVLEQILTLFPRAEVFTIVDLLSPEERHFLRGRPVHTSFLQKLPVLRHHHRKLLPLMPLAVEQFDVSRFDLVISSSHAVAKGVITGPDQLHVCYCHSPIRYAWDLQHQYLRESGLRGPMAWLARYLLHRLRIWDVRTANGVDAFVANSGFVARRVEKVYRRPVTVVHPPVDVTTFTRSDRREDFYLVASRMVPYKRIPLIVEAFRELPDRRLVVIGDGPDMRRVRELVAPNIEVLGYQPSDVLRTYMQRARAFVFAAEEDFGIAPVEAQACGTPVIAYGRGGVRESVVDGVTGLFFEAQTVRDLIDAVTRFETRETTFCPHEIRRNAERFCTATFRRRFSELLAREWRRHRAGPDRAASIPASPAA